MRSNRSLVALLLGALVTAPAAAHAFEDSGQFLAGSLPHAATLTSSSEGVYFTGAPRFAGLDCSACHTEGRKDIALHLDADDGSLFTRGYQPGQVYELVVRLRRESAGLDYSSPTCTEVSAGDAFVPCNNNNFALEIDQELGPLAGPGVFCSRPPVDGHCPSADETTDEVLLAPDGDAVFGNRTHDPGDDRIVTRNGATSWRLWWTAPPEGTGPLKIFIGAVDGNGGGGTVDDNQDPTGDDTVRGVIAIGEAGAPLDLSAAAGCQVDASPQPPPPSLLLGFAALVLARRRRLTRR